MIDIKAKLLIFSLLCICSCRHGLLVRSEKPIAEREAISVIERLKAKKIQSLKLVASSMIDSKKKRVFFKQAVEAKRPSKIYLTALKFGSPFIYASIARDRIVAFDPSSGEYFSGNDADEVFGHMIGIEIAFDDVFEALFGGAFIPESYSIDKAGLLNGRYYRILISEKGKVLKRQYTVDGRDMTLSEILVFENGSSVKVSMSDYKDLDDNLYPTRINLRREAPYAELSVKIEKIEFDPVLEDEKFEIFIPRGIDTLPIEDLNMF